MSDELLGSIVDPELRSYFVWLPVLPADDPVAAAGNEARFNDSRASHYWDPDLAFARQMGAALGIAGAQPLVGMPTTNERIAWDVYLLYPRGETQIDHPKFWMHQLDTTLAHRLDAKVLAKRAREMLSG